MIKELGKEIIVSTKKTTLILSNRNQDLLTTEYYGPRIISDSEVSSLIRSYPYNQGTELSLDEKENISLSQNQIKLAISTLNRSNYFSPTQILSNSKSPVFDFRFKKADISVEPKIPDSWVMPHKPDEELIVLLADEVMKAEIEVHYVIYAKEDVIGQYVIIKNNNSLQLNISKCMSLSLCLINNNDIMTSTYGSWIGELSLAKDKVTPGRKVIESLTGSSSARHNPFFMLEEENTNEVSGNVYGFNLVFSGNHEESVEMDSFGNLRIQTGVASAGLDILLEQKEEFVSPMGIMSFSSEGRNGLAFNMQEFVSSHIIPPQWKNKKRPIIYNNWEATGMKFTKAKLISLMKKAKKLGIELFVLDDGWFSTRNDDSHGLGDWECNRKKIPGGLKSLSKSCKDLGMDFGIWMEPEMVNDDTKVYHDHPEWIIHDNLHYPLKGRHQYTLDLSRKEVQDYLFEAISSVLDNKNVSFLK
ncbi:MAG: alpha-galactosidase, partial [Bacilli bacterium]